MNCQQLAEVFRVKTEQQKARIAHLIGVTTRTMPDGTVFVLDGCNDLGIAYWVKRGGKRQFTIGRETVETLLAQ